MKNNTKYNKSGDYISPDLSKLQEVLIDHRTKIYIPMDSDPELAKKRYWQNMKNKK